MRFKRSFGILMHPTSLPGRYGIGDLGENTYKFIDFMEKTGAKLWQVMPLGPTGYGDSPYACFSAMAGNPLMISPDTLVKEGLLSAAEVETIPDFPEKKVDFGPVIIYKYSLYKKAFANFSASAVRNDLKKDYEDFSSCAENAVWVDDFALFMALKEKHQGAVWSKWAPALAKREPEAIKAAKKELAETIDFHKFLQFIFFRQWLAAKKYANDKGISVVGDVPIFVAYDSADVWTNPEIFHLDASGVPTVVAGVPPDYFSETGQLWGNPLYRWDILAKTGFEWWIQRFREVLKLVDIVRIDHFRGFEACWEVPAAEKTAIKGRWVKAPGKELFMHVLKAIGKLPIIAEDLGVITPEVEKLRDSYNFAGMKILQFAFNLDAKNQYLPHNFIPNSVVYTGTHDNETTAGWFKNLTAKEKRQVCDYLGSAPRKLHHEFIRLAISSVSDIAVVPVQDIIGAGDDGRMNTPGKASGNWSYRFAMNELKTGDAKKIADWCQIFGR